MPRILETAATVLLVEQDDAVRDSLRLLLELHDLNVAVFVSFDDFKRHARADRPTCALIDLKTAAMSGSELLKALELMPFPAPVIMMSGASSTPVGPLPAGGRVQFIKKPYSASELLDAVKQALEAGKPH